MVVSVILFTACLMIGWWIPPVTEGHLLSMLALRNMHKIQGASFINSMCGRKQCVWPFLCKSGSIWMWTYDTFTFHVRHRIPHLSTVCIAKNWVHGHFSARLSIYQSGLTIQFHLIWCQVWHRVHQRQCGNNNSISLRNSCLVCFGCIYLFLWLFFLLVFLK